MEEIICHSKYDYDAIYEFNRFVINRKTSKNTFLGTLMITANIIMAVLYILLTVFFGFDAWLTVALGAFIFLDFVYIFVHTLFLKIIAKKASKIIAEISYRFKENEVEIKAEKPNFTETATTKYDGIIKFEENKNYFYLFISKNQAYIVDINNLENSNPTVLRQFLQDKCSKTAKK